MIEYAGIRLEKRELLAYRLILLFPLVYMLYVIIAKSIGIRWFYFLYSFLIIGLLEIKEKKILLKQVILYAIILLKLLYDTFSYPDSMGDAISFATLILYLDLYSKDECIKKYGVFLVRNSKMVASIYAIYILGILYTVFFANGYIERWGTTSLFGHYGMAHFLAYELLILFCTCVYLFVKERKKIWIAFSVVFGIMIVLTTVRTILLALLVAVVYMFLLKRGTRKWAYSLLLLGVTFVVFRYTKLFSFIIKKTQTAASLGSASSSRALIWKTSYEMFLNGSFQQKLLGRGIQSLMNWNYSNIRMRIQAHNDFISVLVGFGIISCLVYIFFLIRFCHCKGGLGLLLSILVLILFNGLYSYTSFVIGIPIIKLLFESMFEKANHSPPYEKTVKGVVIENI